MVLLMPIYSTELEGADLNNSNYEVLGGDYRAPLRYKKDNQLTLSKWTRISNRQHHKTQRRHL